MANNLNLGLRAVPVLAALIILITDARTTTSQPFAGKIVYTTSMISHIKGVSGKELGRLYGTRFVYVTTGSTYRSEYNGTVVKWQLFVPSENRVYGKFVGDDTLRWEDVSIEPDSIVSWKVNRQKVVVCGHKCDEVLLTTRNGIQKFYCAPDLPLDTTAYARYNMDQCHAVLRLVNGVPLKLILTSPEGVLTSTATSVTPMVPDEALFKLPPGVPTARIEQTE